MPKVNDARAILAHLDESHLSWLPRSDFGTNIVLTYSFSAGYNQPGVGLAGERGHRFTAAEQKNFRKAAAEFSKKSGIVFVETEGRAMINLFDAPSLGETTLGIARLPRYSVTVDYVTTLLMNVDGDMRPGSEGFYVLMHELGHTLGLEHPFEGPFQLTRRADTPQNTVMTYTSAQQAEKITSIGRLDKIALEQMYGTAAEANALKVRVSGDKIVINGDQTNNKVMGTDAENLIYGQGGRDRLMARNADDRLYGGGADDQLDGGGGNDRLYGGGGSDTLDGGLGADRLYGGKHEDRILIEGKDRAYGGDGNDQFVIVGDGDATIWGGAGRDRMIKNGETRLTAYGEGGNDTFEGHQNRVTLFGGGGSDTLTGSYTDDRLFGGKDADRLTGRLGSDLLEGGNGRDVLDGMASADTLFGGTGADKILGGNGNDELFGGGGADQLDGGQDNDLIRGDGGADTLRGESGSDQLHGDGGDDRLFGGGARDTLDGGKGDDRLVGGGGQDRFVFSHGHDVIVDFSGPGSSADEIALDRDALGLTDASPEVALAGMLSVVGDDAVLRIDGSNTLTIEDFTDLDAVMQSITLI